MARGRMIDKRISMSKKLGKISNQSKVLYFMIYPHLDQEGRIAFDDLEDLKVEIIPYFINWSLGKIRISLNELADIELIILYPDRKRTAIEFIRFKDFQTGIRKDREAPSKIKNPPNSGVYRITPALMLMLSVNVKEGMNKEESIKKKEISFNFKERKFINITIEDKAGWLEAYPACDIDQELSKMREWLLGNPTKKKKNYRRFITNWLSRAQDKGGTKIDYRASQVGKDSGKHKTKYPSDFLHRVYGILNKQNKDQNKYADIIFSLSDEEAKTAVEKYNKSPADFIKFLEEDFKIKLKGNQNG